MSTLGAAQFLEAGGRRFNDHRRDGYAPQDINHVA